MSFRLRSVRPAGVLLAATTVIVGLAPAAASAAKPTAAELTDLVDGRIPDLAGIGDDYDISVAPGGQQIAFIARISNGARETIDDAVWTIAADGSSLREVAPDSPGAAGYLEHYQTPQWSPSGRYLSYTHTFPHAPRSGSFVVDLSAPSPAKPIALPGTGPTYSASERFAVVRSSDPNGWPRISATELATGKSLLAQEGDGIPARHWFWSEACSRAQDAGVPATGSPSEVAAQLEGAARGCRLADEPPSVAELSALVDGRVPGLTGFAEIRPSFDGDLIAFVAQIAATGQLPQTEQLWLISRSGDKLQRLEGTQPSPALAPSAARAFAFSDLKWAPGRSLLAYRFSEGSPPTDDAPRWVELDVSGPIPYLYGPQWLPAEPDYSGELPALPEPPTEEAGALATLIDGRIAGIVGFGGIVWSPDRSRVGFSAVIHHPESTSTEPAIWTMNADGSALRLVEQLPGGYSAYNWGLRPHRWSPTGRFFTYYQYRQLAPKTTLGMVDFQTGAPALQFTPGAVYDLVFTARDEFAVYATKINDSARTIGAVRVDGGEPVVLVNDTQPGGAAWTDACKVARDAGVAPSRELEQVAAQLVGSAPGCTLQAPAITPEVPAPETPTTPQQPLTETPTQVVLPNGVAKPAPKLVVSKRLVRSGGKLTALRLKIASAGAARVKAYVIDKSGPKPTTLGRASSKAQGATTLLTVRLGKAANTFASRAKAGRVTVRVVTTATAGASTTTEFKLDLV